MSTATAKKPQKISWTMDTGGVADLVATEIEVRVTLTLNPEYKRNRKITPGNQPYLNLPDPDKLKDGDLYIFFQPILHPVEAGCLERGFDPTQDLDINLDSSFFFAHVYYRGGELHYYDFLNTENIRVDLNKVFPVLKVPRKAAFDFRQNNGFYIGEIAGYPVLYNPDDTFINVSCTEVDIDDAIGAIKKLEQVQREVLAHEEKERAKRRSAK